jgi:hypothetical protein
MGMTERIRRIKISPAIKKLVARIIDGTKYIPLKYARAVSKDSVRTPVSM